MTVGSMIWLAAAAASGGWSPPSLGSARSWWDLALSSITKSGANITQIDDLIGSNHLVPGAANPPLDVASDSDFGGRRAAQHDKANTESMGVTISSESQPLTLWIVATLEVLTGYHALIGDGATADLYFEDGSPDVWTIDDGTNIDQSTVTTPAVDTPYLHVFVLDGTSSRLYVNDVDQGVSPSTFSAAAVTAALIGNNQINDWSDSSWTSAGLTGEAMSASDRTKLYTWSQANCGVA